VVVAGLAIRRIGGATGDVYGACAEMAQLGALLAFAAR
jgi:cobalamin synthase